jgi:hypothetical protein
MVDRHRAPEGGELRVVLALGMNLVFPAAGGYRVVARLGEQGETCRSVSFRVKDMEMGSAGHG